MARRPGVEGRRKTAAGAAAVEGALVLSAVLLPLLLGVVQYGIYFWQAQRVPASVPRLPTDELVGTFACGELVARVTSLLSGAPEDGSGASGLLRQEASITGVLVRPLAGLGADVTVAMKTDAADEIFPLLPLPHDGAVLTEFTTRLDDVRITTGSC
jgi:hypothetical protein